MVNSNYFIASIYVGSKSSIINLEARSLKTWSNRSRHCVFVLMDNFTTEEYNQISAGSGALVLIVPPAPYNQEQQIVRYCPFKIIHTHYRIIMFKVNVGKDISIRISVFKRGSGSQEVKFSNRYLVPPSPQNKKKIQNSLIV